MFGFALLAFLAIIAAVLAGSSPAAAHDPSWPTWFFSVLVLTALTPIARCARLWFLDTAASNPGPLRQGIVAGSVCVTLLTAAIVALLAWNTASPAQRWLQVILWVLAILVGRRLLLWALQRHTGSRDLAA